MGGEISVMFIDSEDSGRVLIVTLLVGEGVAIVSEVRGGRGGFATGSAGQGCDVEGIGESGVCVDIDGVSRASTPSRSPLSLSLARLRSCVGNSASSSELLRFRVVSRGEDGIVVIQNYKSILMLFT